jgi:hypothetical protein
VTSTSSNKSSPTLSEASSLVLSISSPVAAAAQAAPQAQETDPINISDFTLQSSLVLGNLATATIAV